MSCTVIARALAEALACRNARGAELHRVLTCAQLCRLQLRVLDGCSDAGGLQLRGELLARQWCEAAGAAAVALLPNIDPQALTKKLVQVTTAQHDPAPKASRAACSAAV